MLSISYGIIDEELPQGGCAFCGFGVRGQVFLSGPAVFQARLIHGHDVLGGSDGLDVVTGR